MGGGIGWSPGRRMSVSLLAAAISAGSSPLSLKKSVHALFDEPALFRALRVCLPLSGLCV
ncbi:MAG: hypothetical protein ACE5E8_03215 [Acidimicrobiia bacterium]